MDEPERDLLEASLRKLLGATPAGELRGARTAFGWTDVLIEDEEAAVATLFELQGELLAGASALEDLALTAAGFPSSEGTAFVFPVSVVPTSRIETAGSDPVVLLVEGVTVTRPVAPERIVVPVQAPEARTVVIGTPWPEEARWPNEGGGIDPAGGWARLCAIVPVKPAIAVLLDDADAEVPWEATRAACLRALAHELTAVGRVMLGLAVDHVTSRHQFGAPIGTFQAVQHRLAEVCMWQQSAEAAVAAAWEHPDPHSAVLAKILAGRFVTSAGRHCQQVLGGMGFTWEHPFHRYLRRALLLEPFLGRAAELRAALGASLIADRGALPRLAPL